MSESNEEMCLACASKEMQIGDTNIITKKSTLHLPREKLSQSTHKVKQTTQFNQIEQEALSQNNARSKKDGSVSLFV